jgi:hypothetical protein
MVAVGGPKLPEKTVGPEKSFFVIPVSTIASVHVN